MEVLWAAFRELLGPLAAMAAMGILMYAALRLLLWLLARVLGRVD